MAETESVDIALALLLGGSASFFAALWLNLLADARPGNSGQRMYMVAEAVFFCCLLASLLMLLNKEIATASALLCSVSTFGAAAAWTKARKGARLKRMGAVLGLVSHRFLKKEKQTTPRKADWRHFHPRHWLPVYQQWSLYKAGAIARLEVWAALGAYACLALLACIATAPLRKGDTGILVAIFLMALSLDFADYLAKDFPADIKECVGVPLKRLVFAFFGLLQCVIFSLAWFNRDDLAYAAAGTACGIFFATRIAAERAVMLSLATNRRVWRLVSSSALCGTAFFLMALNYALSLPSECLCVAAPPVLRLELLLMAFCLSYPLQRLAFFLLFQCLEALWLRLGSRRTWRAAYLRVRQMWLFEGVMAALAAAALLRALSTNVGSFAKLNVSLCALLALPLALRFVQKARPAL